MFKKISLLTPIMVIMVSTTGCSGANAPKTVKAPIKKGISPAKIEVVPVVYEKRKPNIRKTTYRRPASPRRKHYNSFASQLSNAALGRLRSNVTYNGSYVKIAYPWGDVPQNTGVCTDVVIRSYRKLGIDLQQQVHRDISSAFYAYPNPKKWGLSRPDTNIDHRRVYNLRAFFARRGAALPITRNPTDYRPGDIVTWMLGPDLPHIGVVVNRPSKADPRRKMIVHNIARGPQMEDILFRFPITGHYRYTRAHMGNIPKTIYASNARSSRSTGFNAQQLRDASNLLASIPARPRTVARKAQVLSNADMANFASKALTSSLQVATLNQSDLDQNAISDLMSR